MDDSILQHAYPGEGKQKVRLFSARRVCEIAMVGKDVELVYVIRGIDSANVRSSCSTVSSP
jgi:hypothetical protein